MGEEQIAYLYLNLTRNPRSSDAFAALAVTIMHASYLFAILESGLPALRVISVIAILIFAGIGIYIYGRGHQLFDRDPQIAGDEDGPGARHVRLELILFAWGGVMLVLISTLYEIWRT